MVLKSFAVWLHEDRICPTARGAKYCPGSAEALVMAGLGPAERAQQPLEEAAAAPT